MAQRLFILFVVFLSSYGCATHQVKPVDTRAVETYKNRVSIDGVLAATDPYDDAEKAQQGFYQDVTREGFSRYNWYLRMIPVIA